MKMPDVGLPLPINCPFHFQFPTPRTFDDAVELHVLVPLAHVRLAELPRAELPEVLRRS